MREPKQGSGLLCTFLWTTLFEVFAVSERKIW
jgi:hypothetical protein